MEQINTFQKERLEHQSHRSHKYHTKSHQLNRFLEIQNEIQPECNSLSKE